MDPNGPYGINTAMRESAAKNQRENTAFLKGISDHHRAVRDARLGIGSYHNHSGLNILTYLRERKLKEQNANGTRTSTKPSNFRKTAGINQEDFNASLEKQKQIDINTDIHFIRKSIKSGLMTRYFNELTDDSQKKLKKFFTDKNLVPNATSDTLKFLSQLDKALSDKKIIPYIMQYSDDDIFSLEKIVQGLKKQKQYEKIQKLKAVVSISGGLFSAGVFAAYAIVIAPEKIDNWKTSLNNWFKNDAPADQNDITIKCTNTRLNIRTGPSQASTSIAVLQSGASVEVQNSIVKGDWQKAVTVHGGQKITGYVHNDYIKPCP